MLNRFVSVFVLAISGAGNLLAFEIDPSNTRMLAEPAISQEHIAFSYDGDLWLANRDGSSPRRLTSHEGLESRPCFSPDGQSIAFTAQYDGNQDVYLISVNGGSPKRLTWHPAADYVEAFTPDGKSVLFSSSRNTFTNRFRKLFTVSTAGGFPAELPIPNGLNATYSADGKKIAYNPLGERFSQWKNYRGGTVSRIWIYDTADHSVQMVRQPEGRCNDTDPVFIGNKLYFRSDREGEFNLFSFDPRTEAIEALTQFSDFPVQAVEGDGSGLILEQAGYLHLFDVSTSSLTTLKVGVATDLTERRTRFESGAKWVRAVDISPTGARAVMEFRGEIVTLPAEKGDPRNLTATSGIHERSPVWSPNGESIACFSDAGGEYRLHIVPQNGKGETAVYSIEGNGFYEDPKWSPDGTKISYRDNSWSLYVFDIAKKVSTKICSAPYYGPPGVRGISHNWSPDSKWLVYTNNTRAMIQQAHVFSIDSGESTPITDGLSEVSEPVFSRDGKFIYFVASTDAGPVKDWFAMSNNDMELSNRIYVVVLNDADENPLKAQSDEEKGSVGESSTGETKVAAAGSATEAKATAPQVRIDFAGLDQRIVALPLPTAVYSGLSAGADGSLLYVRRDREGKSSLASYSVKDRKETMMLEGVQAFVISTDGKKLLYNQGGGFGIAAASGRIDPGNGRLAVDRVSVRIDPVQEWKQIFHEVWRINRDYFYDPNMHGSNWPAMRERYEPLVGHCATRDDLNRILMWMCSELAVGHHRVGGGDVRMEAETVPGGLLGADFEVVDGHYRFRKVFGGLNYNGDLRAPLTEPGVRVQDGEFLLRVNGVELTAEDNVYRHFENQAGKMVELTVGSNSDGTDSRVVTVVPVEDESALRNRDWIEGNLRRVTEATDGQVAYVYVPNTTGAGHSYFKRYFFPQTDRKAIIVDERFNGGGQVADYYIDHLRRPYISHWATRYGDDIRTPAGTIEGPKVMLIDETAGSGGDLLPWMFNKLDIGTLIGRRTWGGLVGILGFPVLMDGGSVTAPNLAIWTEDGFIVENVGVPPDIEVEQWPAEVIAGRDPQLEKAIEVVMKQLAENPPKEHKKPPYPVRSRNQQGD